MKKIIFSVLIVILVIGFSYGTNKPKKSYAEMAACLDDSNNIARYQSLFNQLTKSFNLSEQKIADQTAFAITFLKKEGIKESFLNIMEGMNSISMIIKGTYADILSMYCTLRNKGLSHKDALDGVVGIWQQLNQSKK